MQKQMNLLSSGNGKSSNIQIEVKNEMQSIVSLYRHNRFICAFVVPFSFKRIEENENEERDFIKSVCEFIITKKKDYESLFVL